MPHWGGIVLWGCRFCVKVTHMVVLTTTIIRLMITMRIKSIFTDLVAKLLKIAKIFNIII